MLGQLFRNEALQFLAKCVRECFSVEGMQVYDGDSRMEFVTMGFSNGGFRPTFSDYDKSRNSITVFETEDCVLQKQRVYATHEFVAERMIMSSSVLTRGQSDEGKEIWVGKELLLSRCIVRGIKRPRK